MPFTPIAPNELNGSFDSNLLEKAEYVYISSVKLLGGHNQTVLDEIKKLLRITNSYYSNRIESEGTHPINIEQAMKKNFSSNSNEKKLQYLSLAHIKSQELLEEMVFTQNINPFDISFIKMIHKIFYEMDGMDEFLTIIHKDKQIKMLPGSFREDDVAVGEHIAISYMHLTNTMDKFCELYTQSITHGSKAQKLIYILSSHHRFVWIHPFLDGNGRVSRLLLDTLVHKIGIEGYGIWNFSRGLARNNTTYKKLLSLADEKKYNEYDGRGTLSKKELYSFVEFLLDSAIDQVDYMNKMLNLSSLINRVENYVKNSNQNMYNIEPLPKHSDKLLKELLIKGIVKRGDVQHIIGTKDRIASSLISELLKREYIRSDTPRGDIRIKFNAHFAMKIFPELIPDFD
jgi:Fic family protein